MLNDWSTFSQNLLCFKRYKSCLPDFSSKRLLVILMFPLLINPFLPQGSNEISRMVALGHWFLAEILESIIPLTSSSKGLWSRLFVPERMKIYLILELSEKSNFWILHNICCILSPGIPKFKVLWREKVFFPNFRVSAEIADNRITIKYFFDDDWISKPIWSLNLIYQPGLPVLKVGIKRDATVAIGF